MDDMDTTQMDLGLDMDANILYIKCLSMMMIICL